MADIHGIKGFNKANPAFNQIFVAYGNDLVNLGNGAGFNVNLNLNQNVEFEVLGDNLFFQNYVDRPLHFDGVSWTSILTGKTPVSKYIRAYNSRLFLGNCAFTAPQAPQTTNGNNIIYPSRIFYSDLFQANALTWGIEWGQNGSTLTNSKIFEVTTTGGTLVQDFKAHNIKVGDPLFITSGNNQLVSDKPYLVTDIASPYRLIVDREFSVTANSLHFWVGSNWIEVETTENDPLSGFEESGGRLLIFKPLSVFLATSSSTSAISQLLQLKGARGTTSSRSIITDNFGNTYWFHGSTPQLSGIYKFDRVNVTKISRQIDPFIAGMVATDYANVVAWSDGNELRWYLGSSISNSNFDISMTNAVASLNIDAQVWSVDSLADSIVDSTTFRIGDQQFNYTGNGSNKVMKMNTGNNFNGMTIPATLETKPYYPKGPEIINTFSYIQVVGRQTKGIRIKYKLWDNPSEIDQRWFDLGELVGDKTEFIIPHSHNQASGIQLKFEETGTFENDFYIERIAVFYTVSRTRLLSDE